MRCPQTQRTAHVHNTTSSRSHIAHTRLPPDDTMARRALLAAAVLVAMLGCAAASFNGGFGCKVGVWRSCLQGAHGAVRLLLLVQRCRTARAHAQRPPRCCGKPCAPRATTTTIAIAATLTTIPFPYTFTQRRTHTQRHTHTTPHTHTHTHNAAHTQRRTHTTPHATQNACSSSTTATCASLCCSRTPP